MIDSLTGSRTKTTTIAWLFCPRGAIACCATSLTTFRSQFHFAKLVFVLPRKFYFLIFLQNFLKFFFAKISPGKVLFPKNFLLRKKFFLAFLKNP